jgi:hypothetical protein
MTCSTWDTFTMFVESTSGEGAFAEAPIITRVDVLAPTETEATLTALQMVAARGRCPISVTVDWDNF